MVCAIPPGGLQRLLGDSGFVRLPRMPLLLLLACLKGWRVVLAQTVGRLRPFLLNRFSEGGYPLVGGIYM